MLIENPFFMRNPQSVNTIQEQNVEKSDMLTHFMAILNEKTDLNKIKKAPCDLCSFVGSSQNNLTAHILDNHVSPE